jgi:hypothetical protein
MALFSLIPLPWRFALYAGVVMAALGAFAAYRQSLVNDGWDRALEAVKVQDGTAKEAASKAQRTVDECYDANGSWSVITGTCTEAVKP